MHIFVYLVKELSYTGRIGGCNLTDGCLCHKKLNILEDSERDEWPSDNKFMNFILDKILFKLFIELQKACCKLTWGWTALPLWTSIVTMGVFFKEKMENSILWYTFIFSSFWKSILNTYLGPQSQWIGSPHLYLKSGLSLGAQNQLWWDIGSPNFTGILWYKLPVFCKI